MSKYIEPLTRALALASVPGYRVITLLLIIFLSSDVVANKYAEIILFSSFISAFSGSAVACQIYIPRRSMSWMVLMAYTVGLTSVCVAVLVLFGFVGDLNLLVLFSTGLFMSVFEVLKADSLVAGRFRRILVAGVLSSLALPLAILLLGENLAYLAVSVFCMPVIFMLPVHRRSSFSLDEFNNTVSADILSYSISNSFSTGIGFLMPILILRELGGNTAQDLSLLSMGASIFYLYPRFLSAALIIKFQKVIEQGDLKAVERQIFYGFFGVGIFLVLINNYIQISVVSSIFFMSLLLTQIALPSANAINVMGLGKQILRVNIIFVVLLIICCLLSYFTSTAGPFRALLYVSSFGLCVLVRVFMTKNIARLAMLQSHSEQNEILG